MGLGIKRAETERKARAVAERMGVSVTEAIDRRRFRPDGHRPRRLMELRALRVR